jgi:hypothetical protein
MPVYLNWNESGGLFPLEAFQYRDVMVVAGPGRSALNQKLVVF